MSQSIKIMKNSLAILVGRIYHALLSLVAVGLIARYLKVERFGDYAFILAICTVFMVITDMGIHRIGIREMSRDLSRANDIFWASSFAKAILSILTFLGIALTINIMSSDKEVIHATYICAVAVIVFFLGDIFLANYIAFERMGYAALSHFIEGTAYLFFVALFIHLNYGLNGIFWALLFSYVARISFGFIVTYKNFFKLQFSLNLPLAYYLIKEGFPIGLNRILQKASVRIDTILIKLMRSRAEVGIYHGPYRIILTLVLVPQSITEAIFPMISRLAVESKDAVSQVLERSFKFMLIMVIPLAMVMISFSSMIINIVLGKEFVKSIPVLQIFSIVWGIMFFNELFTKFLSASNRQALATKAMAICLGINVILDVILIYFYGYFGAVIATLFAELSLSISAYLFISKTMGVISWKRILPKPLLSAIPTVIAVSFLNLLSPFIAVPVGIGIFYLCLFLLGAFEQNEIELFREIFHKMIGYLDLKTYQKRASR
ncbi:MAG: flippase [Thermodesulfovibrionales bacterium]